MSKTLIHDFYTAFSRRDAEAMAACYHPEATFRDGAFTLNSGAEVGDMWRMLCQNGKDMRIEFRDITSNDLEATAHWEAWYTFSKTGRKVHNIIDAAFKFKDGKIIEHVDTFGFWRWSRQSLGPIGLLLGWTPFLQNKVRASAMNSLAQFRQKKG